MVASSLGWATTNAEISKILYDLLTAEGLETVVQVAENPYHSTLITFGSS